MSFTPAGGGGWTKFVRGALDAAQTVGDLIEVSKSALRLASGEGDLDDLVTLGITGAGLGAGGLPPGKGKPNINPPTPRKPRLPESDGHWLGDRGKSEWVSNKPEVNRHTGGEPVPFNNNYPDFSRWSQKDVQIPNMTGDNGPDFSAADQIFARDKGWLKKDGTPNASESFRYRKKNNLTWHHHEDGTTMQLVPRELHENIPHTGGASLVKNPTK